MVLSSGTMPAYVLYILVTLRAAEALEVGTGDIFSMYEKRHFAAYRSPIYQLGFYNCCTVEVKYRETWWLPVALPGGIVFYVEADPCHGSENLYNSVIHSASVRLGLHKNYLYATMEGKPFGHLGNMPLLRLGFSKKSKIVVQVRHVGGVCVAQDASGRKRAVSSEASQSDIRISTQDTFFFGERAVTISNNLIYLPDFSISKQQRKTQGERGTIVTVIGRSNRKNQLVDNT